MNTMQLECFTEVAENLNFARAAEKLHISQPSVTHQINSLEEELDIKLFKRTTRSVKLTQAGLIFYPDAQNMLSIMNLSKTKLHNNSMLRITPIGIGCHSSFDLNLISKILEKLNDGNSIIHPIIKTIPFQSLTSLLRDEVIDVFFAYLDQSRQDSLFQFTPLSDAPMNVILPKEHPLSHKKTLTEQDLKNECIIMMNPDRTPNPISGIHRKISADFDPARILYADTPEICFCLVRAHLGFTLMPAIPLMADYDLVYIPFEPLTTISYGIYSKKNTADTPLKEMIAAAAVILQNELPS